MTKELLTSTLGNKCWQGTHCIGNNKAAFRASWSVSKNAFSLAMSSEMFHYAAALSKEGLGRY